MTIQKELYTVKSLLTLGGASVAVVASSGTIGYVFGFNPRWLGLLFAFLIAFTGLGLLPDAQRDTDRRRRFVLLVVAFFNGFLIYAQAVGFNTLNQAVPSPPHTTKQVLVPVVDPIPWWTSAEQKRAAGDMVDAVTEWVTTSERIVVGNADDVVDVAALETTSQKLRVSAERLRDSYAGYGDVGDAWYKFLRPATTWGQRLNESLHLVLWALAVGGVAYGLIQRKLRELTVARLSAHQLLLEQALQQTLTLTSPLIRPDQSGQP